MILYSSYYRRSQRLYCDHDGDSEYDINKRYDYNHDYHDYVYNHDSDYIYDYDDDYTW